MIRACLWLTIGCILLLGGGLVWQPTAARADPIFLTLTFAGMGLHFLGWIELGGTLVRFRALHLAASPQLRAMTWAYVASLVAFGLAPLVLRWYFPGGSEATWSLATYLAFFFYVLSVGVLPYLPGVFAPVVLAHAVFFLSGSFSSQSRRAFVVIRAGTALLGAVAVAAVILQLVLGADPTSVKLFAGMAGAGYAFVLVGWLHETVGATVVIP